MLSEKDFRKQVPVSEFCKCEAPDLADTDTCKTCGKRIEVIEK